MIIKLENMTHLRLHSNLLGFPSQRQNQFTVGLEIPYKYDS